MKNEGGENNRIINKNAGNVAKETNNNIKKDLDEAVVPVEVISEIAEDNLGDFKQFKELDGKEAIKPTADGGDHSNFKAFKEASQEQFEEFKNALASPEERALAKAYQLLGLTDKATDSEIQKQYKNLAVQSHPDMHRNEDLAQQLQHEEKFKVLGAALETIMTSRTKSAPTEEQGPRLTLK